MIPNLIEQLGACRSLPSPPSVATRIIRLANDPEVDIDEIAETLALDPAITTKILRVVNSPMYSQVRKTESLNEAVIVLGLNASISLALSFSLLNSFQSDNASSGLDFNVYWRRAILAATSSRVVARAVGFKAAEELFLASLIQDIGMLALEQSVPGIYENLPEQTRQTSVIQRERDMIGADHAGVGGWLLERWNFPTRIQQAVAASHDLDTLAAEHEHGLFARCVAVTGLIADVFLNDTSDLEFKALATIVREHLSLENEELGEILEEVGSLIPDAEAVFETRILTESDTIRIMGDAKDALMIRNLHALQAVNSLQGQADSLENRTIELEETSRRDALTGLYNRRYLDHFLESAFARSMENDEPLSIAFTDLDNFKLINDTYGHQIGDQILAATANILIANVRSTDIIARYGGEEFVIVFPNSGSEIVSSVCQRIVRAFEETRHDVGVIEDIAVTISVGMATQGESREFESFTSLVRAADKALCNAKSQGRSRSIPFDLVENLKVGRM